MLARPSAAPPWRRPLNQRLFDSHFSGVFMAKLDGQLLQLLTPIFLRHAEEIEAMLPPDLRSNWRKATAFTRRSRGPKPLDHRDLLLAMAELDADGAQPARALAAEVIGRFPRLDGAGLDDRDHVQLPDGSCPARKDLLDRLEARYEAEKAALIAEVCATRRLVDRASKRAERLARDGVHLTPRLPVRTPTAAFVARLRALSDTKVNPRNTAQQVDAVRDAIMKAGQKR